MGIRIHKRLEWVLDCSLDLQNLEDLKVKDLLDEYPNDLELRMDLTYPSISMNENFESIVIPIDELIDNENSHHYTLFQPMHQYKSWSRYDDMIDYLENDSCVFNIQYINSDLFPFCNRFVVSKSLKLLDDFQRKMCLIPKEIIQNLTKEKKEELEKLGLDCSEELKLQIHQSAPRLIELLLKKIDPSINYLELKPAIITYWS
jgi:hypothetical protein